MGKPARGNARATLRGRRPGEVKHLSNRRRRNRRDALSSGERKGRSLNQGRVKPASVAFLGLRDRLGSVAELPGSYKGFL